MSIQAEINRINANIVNAYNAIEAKGGTIPLQTNSANLASAIESISGGGGDINITNGQIKHGCCWYRKLTTSRCQFEHVRAQFTNSRC